MRRFPSSNNNNKMLLYGMLAAAALIVSLSGTALATDDEPLRCYQCRVEKNEDCTDEYLRECPTDQAYDVCMVSVINNEITLRKNRAEKIHTNSGTRLYREEVRSWPLQPTRSEAIRWPWIGQMRSESEFV
ncbi:uncharacterized protein LOC111252002 isoform X1 [Varroa destructor]|uniref:Uncharacterized protein n=1 Tax=Varroa destructor TaxID=109461 RepID=A0A7M7KCW9_VARDE|nr:uncharacterized protein LOC111252002 isoform X1 [Varroa destructor]